MARFGAAWCGSARHEQGMGRGEVRFGKVRLGTSRAWVAAWLGWVGFGTA